MEERNFSDAGSAQNAAAKTVGGGTPLKDRLDAESPLYVASNKHNPVVTIGPGTPLNEPDAQTETETPVATKSAATVPAASAAPSAAAVAPAEAESAVGMDSAEEPEEDGDFAQELAQALEADPNPGEVVRGHVIRIDDDGVVVDIGYKSEGIIPKNEFLDARGELTAKPGDEVEVLLERRENRDGLLVLSKQKVDRRKGWNIAKAALANNSSVEGIIFQQCKGGFMVELGGVQAFLPSSQLDLGPIKNTAAFMNKKLTFKVIKLNRERGNIVVSRRNFLIEEKSKKRSDILTKITPGRLIHGVVKNITNFGAFVDIGGVDALLHVNDMAWSKVTHPKQIVNIGDEIEALVLTVDEQTGKIALGLKQKSQDPWLNIAGKYPKGSLVEGEVVSLTDFGAFLRLEEGVEALLPVSELSWTQRVRHPKDILKAGDSIRVMVIALDPTAKKITLSLRQTEQEPFTLFAESHKAGEILMGEVKSTTRFGAFVEVADGVSGLVHISDLAWNSNNRNPEDIVKVGDKIRVKILEIVKDKKKISLGLKQLSEDPWTEAAKKYSMGKVVKVKVVRNTKFGVFVELEPGIEGLIHISQLEKGKGKGEPEVLPEGQEIEAKVIKVNSGEHKIGLSIKDALNDQEAAELKKYMSPENKPTFSLAEASGINFEELMKRVSAGGKNTI